MNVKPLLTGAAAFVGATVLTDVVFDRLAPKPTDGAVPAAGTGSDPQITSRSAPVLARSREDVNEITKGAKQQEVPASEIQVIEDLIGGPLPENLKALVENGLTAQENAPI